MQVPAILIFLAAVLQARTAEARGLLSYLSSYRLALELRGAGTASTLIYDTPLTAPLPGGCARKELDSQNMRCRIELSENAKSPWGLSIQQAFRREGWWHSNFDIGFSFFSLSSGYDRETLEQVDPQPMEKARLHLYGLNGKVYYEFGLTPPKFFPDLLFSIGLGRHVSAGNLKIDDHRQNVSIDSNILYLQGELVWWRFKDGSFSSYAALESNSSARSVRSSLGAYSNIALQPSSWTYGILKFVIPFSTRQLK